MNKKLIILDLDETPIFASDHHLGYDHDFAAGHYLVYIRPHTLQFIDFCFAHFRVAVWTSSGEAYEKIIVEKLFAGKTSLEFVWSRDRCTQRFDPELHDFLFQKFEKSEKKGIFS